MNIFFIMAFRVKGLTCKLGEFDEERDYLSKYRWSLRSSIREREGGPQAMSAWKEYIEIELTVTSI